MEPGLTTVGRQVDEIQVKTMLKLAVDFIECEILQSPMISYQSPLFNAIVLHDMHVTRPKFT